MRSYHPRKLATAVLVLASLLSTLAVSAPATANVALATVPPFDLIPAGPAPTTVPYGIGTRVFYGGTVSDIASSFTADNAGEREFDRVAGSLGITYTQFFAYGADCLPIIGRIAPAVPWRRVVEGLGGCKVFDVSTGGLVGVPDDVAAYRSTGTLYANYPRVNPRELPGAGSDDVYAAGERFVVDEWGAARLQGVFLWYPGGTPQKLPNNYSAVGRLGVGWLGARQGSTSCWKTAPADHPYRLRPPILCSQAKPLLSADGTRAVLVQSGRVVVLDARTGTLVSTATLPAITGWLPGTREAVPAAWESTDSYLIEARYDGALALVRCSAATGTCNRGVRSFVRTGVSRIVTERGSADAVAAAN